MTGPSETSILSNYRLRLSAPCPHAGGLAPVLARHLGLCSDEITARMQAGTGVLCDSLDLPRVRRLLPFLRALGLSVRAEKEGSGTLNLALLPMPDVLPEDLAPRLAPVLELSAAATVQRLGVPGGLVLTGLTPADRDRLVAILRPLRGIRCVTSDPETARYGLFATSAPAATAPLGAVGADLRRLGLGRCGVSGALAQDLDRASGNWLMRRHPGQGLMLIDTAFQRFDLFLTGASNMSHNELADFLAPRLGIERTRLAGLSRAAPLRLEVALPLATLRQFATDYAAIGLATAARLVGGARRHSTADGCKTH
jgi:hypothetical protein